MRPYTIPILAGMILLISGTLSAAETDLNSAIAKHRMGTITVHAAPGADVEIEQIRHEFWFGAALANGMFGSRGDSSDARKYKEVFLDYFNSAVTENAVKWHSMERQKGQVDYTIVDSILEWADQNDIPVRGHNIFWGIPKFVQPWLKELDDEALRETLKQRAFDIGKRYKGRFTDYDLNNEMIHGNYYADRLGNGITKLMQTWFHQEDPDTPLFLNDYDILTGNRLDDYVKHIRELLDDGVAIGGIGVQGHLHGVSFEPDALQNALDTLAQFNLPIRVTEFNMPGQRSPYQEKRDLKLTDEQEEQKANDIVAYYKICFAHPAVDGILMWGFWERANWIPASSLFRADWSPTPAAHAYRDLIYNQWWTRNKGKTDDDGLYAIPAFYGKHRIRVNGKEQMVEMKKADGKADVTFSR
jgi:endo-1,4-beta-xylanase